LSNRPTPPAKNALPPANQPGAHNKVFAEKSRSHLQIIRECIGQLFTDPTRQETLRRLKHAAIAINNLAKRFVVDVVAAYAATIEEICERVLDGEINMSKKLVNAFTEIPAIFDGMLHGDTDAFAEAKRHQERLQQLADSFSDGEVVQRQTDIKRSAPANFSAHGMDAPGQKAAAMPATKTAPPNNRPRSDTEVMEYLDDLFAEGKMTSR
jgi:chemotaxis protein histidine kinase CheA